MRYETEENNYHPQKTDTLNHISQISHITIYRYFFANIDYLL